MKNFFVLIFSFLVFGAGAQTSVYHPFPDSSAVWTQSSGDCCASYCPSPPPMNPVIHNYDETYQITGDTVINSMTYHKLWKSGSIYEHCASGNYLNNWYGYSGYFGAIRQDIGQKKVFFVQAGSATDQIMYDFNLHVGDTVHNMVVGVQNCAIVSSIDSVYVGGDFRKKFNMGGFTSASWIEGIGSTWGLFVQMCSPDIQGTLICFKQNESIFYPDTAIACDIVTRKAEIAAPPQLSISPNPMHTGAHATFSDDFSGADLVLYNLYGQAVKYYSIAGEIVMISREGLANGIYFCRAVNRKGQAATARIIIE
jgi:hypothetical protein